MLSHVHHIMSLQHAWPGYRKCQDQMSMLPCIVNTYSLVCCSCALLFSDCAPLTYLALLSIFLCVVVAGNNLMNPPPHSIHFCSCLTLYWMIKSPPSLRLFTRTHTPKEGEGNQIDC